MIKLFSVKVRIDCVNCSCMFVWYLESWTLTGFQDKQKEAAAAGHGKNKQSAGELRLQKGNAELSLWIKDRWSITYVELVLQTCQNWTWEVICQLAFRMARIRSCALRSQFPLTRASTSMKIPAWEQSLMQFTKQQCSCCPFRSGTFVFSFNIPTGYPHEAPKVKCNTKVSLVLKWRPHRY